MSAVAIFRIVLAIIIFLTVGTVVLVKWYEEKVLLTIAILNWINVILMTTFIIIRFCNR